MCLRKSTRNFLGRWVTVIACFVLLASCSPEPRLELCSKDLIYLTATGALRSADEHIGHGRYKDAIRVLDAAPADIGRFPDTNVIDDRGLRYSIGDSLQIQGNFVDAARVKRNVLERKIADHAYFNCRK